MGRERVTNNLLASSSDWTLFGGWTISSGVLSADGTGGANLARPNDDIVGMDARAGGAFTAKRRVSLRFEITADSGGTLEVVMDGDTREFSGVDAYSVVFEPTYTSNNKVQFRQKTSDPWTGSIDNVFATVFGFTRYGVGGVRRDFFGFAPKTAGAAAGPHPASDLTRYTVGGAAREYLGFTAKAEGATPPDVIPTSPKNLDSQIAEDLTDTFFRLADVPEQWETDLCDAFFRLADVPGQWQADLNDTFFAIDMGFAVNASLGADTATAVPVSGGTAVVGIFDDGTSEGGERGGPRWYGKASDAYVIGRYITIGTEGTFQIDAIDPEGDGLVFECLLSVRT